MKTYQAMTLGLVAGFGLGAAAIHGLHAQAQPPAFYIAMNDVSDPANYQNEFAKESGALITSQGGRYIIRGGKVTALQGEAPKARIVILQWENMDKLLAWYRSPKNTELQKIGAKYATFHTFAVEGVAQ